MSLYQDPMGPGWLIFFRELRPLGSGITDDGVGIDYLARKRQNEAEVMALIMIIEDDE